MHTQAGWANACQAHHTVQHRKEPQGPYVSTRRCCRLNWGHQADVCNKQAGRHLLAQAAVDSLCQLQAAVRNIRQVYNTVLDAISSGCSGTWPWHANKQLIAVCGSWLQERQRPSRPQFILRDLLCML